MNEARTQADKPLLHIVPSYQPALRYYQKLLPDLEKRYRVRIVLIGKPSMQTYCEEQGLPYEVLWLRKKHMTWRDRLPFYSPLQERLAFRPLCDAFLERTRPAKILMSPPSLFQRRYLAAKARAMGIPTIGLQWSLSARENKNYKKYFTLLRNPRRYPQLIGNLALDAHRLVLRGIIWLGERLYLLPRLTYPKRNTDTLGVFDELAKENFVLTGTPPDSITIVGTLESERIEGLMQELKHDPSKRAALCERFGLDADKRIILVPSTTFHIESPTHYTDQAGQLAYFGAVFREIREVYDPDEAQIVFKPHPREPEIYGDIVAQHHVVSAPRDAAIDELIAISALVINHPMSSSNFPVIASGVPLLCINFTPLSFMDATARYYHIHHVIKTHEELRKRLRQAKEGTLPAQYDADGLVDTPRRRILEFIG